MAPALVILWGLFLLSSQCRNKGALFGLLKSAWRRSVSQLVFHSFCNRSVSVTCSDFQKANLSKLFSLGYTSAPVRNCTWAQPKVTGLKHCKTEHMPKLWKCAEMSAFLGNGSQESIVDDNLAPLWTISWRWEKSLWNFCFFLSRALRQYSTSIYSSQ